MKLTHFAALVPCFALIFSPLIANHVTPYVLGLPFLLFWIMLWTFLSTVILAGIYYLDHKGLSK